MKRLRPVHVQQLLNVMADDNTSGRLREITYNTLRLALRDAMEMGLIARNPAQAVRKPTAIRKEINYLDQSQARRLIRCAKDDPLGALYILAITTGLRQGEMLGLQWGDIDLRARSLAVRRQLRELSGELELGPTKTSAARRNIVLPEIAAQALQRHRAS